MAEAATIRIETNPVQEAEHEVQETEQIQEHEVQEAEAEQWQNALSNVAGQLTGLVSVTQELSQRIPANMTELLQTQAEMIRSQQATIEGLIRESMATVRSLLTPPEPAVVIPTETIPAIEPVEAVQEVPSIAPVRRYRGL